MDMLQIFRILWARKIVVGLGILLTVVATAAISFSMNKSYTASTTMLLAISGSDPITGQTVQDRILRPGYMETQIDILSSRSVALRVIDNLDLTQDESFRSVYFSDSTIGSVVAALHIREIIDWFTEVYYKVAFELEIVDTPFSGEPSLEGLDDETKFRYWLAEYLQDNTTIEPSREGKTITLSYEGSNPTLAAQVAQAFANAYIQKNLNLRVDPAKQNAVWFNERIQVLRDNLAESQLRLSEYKKEAQVISTDARLDLEAQRLEVLTTQLLNAKNETVALASRQRQLEQDLEKGQAAASSFPEILENALIQKYKVDLATKVAELDELKPKVSKNHPGYQRALKSLANIRQEIAKEVENVIRSMDSSLKVARQSEAEIEAALEEQKQKVLALRSKYDAISVLEQEVQSNQEAFESALARFEQADLEAQATQTNISILNHAIPPSRPSSPKTRLNIVIAFVAGGLLGSLCALMIEWGDRRVRSRADIEQFLGVAVIGEIYKGTVSRKILKARTSANTNSPAPENVTAVKV